MPTEFLFSKSYSTSHTLVVPNSSLQGNHWRLLCAALLACTLFWGSALLGAQPCYAQQQTDEEIQDPFEGFNRAVFQFNDTVDVYFLEPLARGYDTVVPDPVESSVNNFFINLRSPVYMVSDLLQLRLHDFTVHTSRFFINSTIGILGIFDVAKHFELTHTEQDFGLTLGRWGVGSGPYLVLPLLGPSTIRDFSGSLVDRGLDPMTYTFAISGLSWEEQLALSSGTNTIELLNTRSRLLGTIESAKGAALDYYLFVRSAYGQRRAALILGDTSPDSAVPSGAFSGATTAQPTTENTTGSNNADSLQTTIDEEDEDLYIFED